MRKILHIAFLIVALAACKEVFNPPPQSLVNASLHYSNKELTSKKIIFSVIGLGMDNFWVEKDSTSNVLLPLSDGKHTGFIFKLNNFTDTIIIQAEPKLIYESMESGFYREFKIEEILHTTYRIDSIVIQDSVVTKEWNENIAIYINTLTDPRN